MKEACDNCPASQESRAVYRITATTLDGTLLDTHNVCAACVPRIFEVGEDEEEVGK